MKKDIKDRADIELLVSHFYNKVKKDELIAPFFNDIIHIDWEKHIPIMCDFWENLLFFTGKYEGNPMAKHQNIHQISRLKMEHFRRWETLFSDTVHENFKGTNANKIIEKALNIGTVMQMKLFK
jgi:hemoglobin